MSKRKRRSGGSKPSPKLESKRNKQAGSSPVVLDKTAGHLIGETVSVHSVKSVARSARSSVALTATNASDLNGFGGSLDESSSAPAVTMKLPPLVVKSIPLSTLKENLVAEGIVAQYKLCGIGIKVMMRTKNDFLHARNYLTRIGAEHFTHDVPSEKPFKAVVRGLPVMDIKDIEWELKDRYKLQPLHVFPLIRKDVNNTYRDCLYLVHFKKGTVSLNALKAVRIISYIVVRWEAYRGKNRDVTQCMRCLNFGHGTRNCAMKPRCNICAQAHLTAKCPVEGAVALKCVHCGEGHRSTDKVCSKREEYKRIRLDASQRHQPGRKPNMEPVTTTKQNSQQQQQQNSSKQQTRAGASASQHHQLANSSQQSATVQHPLAWLSAGAESVPSANIVQFPTQVSPEVSSPLLDQQLPPKFTAAQLLPIFAEMCDKLQQCQSRQEQIRVLGQFLIQYAC